MEAAFQTPVFLGPLLGSQPLGSKDPNFRVLGPNTIILIWALTPVIWVPGRLGLGSQVSLGLRDFRDVRARAEVGRLWALDIMV